MPRRGRSDAECATRRRRPRRRPQWPQSGRPAGCPLDIFADLGRRVADILLRLVARGVLPPGIDLAATSVHPAPYDRPFDAVVDAALVHARVAGTRGLDPRAFARLLAAEMASEPSLSDVEPTDRGFVNVAFAPGVFAAALAELVAGGAPAPAPRRPWPEDGTIRAARAVAVDEALAALDAAAGGAALMARPQRLVPPFGPIGPPAQGRRTDSNPTGGEPPVDSGAPAPASVAIRSVGPVSVVRRSGRAVPAGGAVGLREAADACGGAALRFALAAAAPAAPLALDLDALADRWHGNPAFWIPHVHARCRAALRRAASRHPGGDLSASALAGDALAHLHRPADLRALRAVMKTPWVVSRCAASGSARRLALHLAEVADAVRARSNASTYQPQSRFVNEERRASVGVRLGLVSACALVLESGLGILGLTAPDEML